MPEKLPVVSGREAIKVFVKMGFEVRKGKGDHFVLKKGYTMFAVPLQNPLKKGTLKKILKQAGVSVEEFNELL